MMTYEINNVFAFIMEKMSLHFLLGQEVDRPHGRSVAEQVVHKDHHLAESVDNRSECGANRVGRPGGRGHEIIDHKPHHEDRKDFLQHEVFSTESYEVPSAGAPRVLAVTL